MKKFYIEGKTNSGIPFFGAVIDVDIHAAMKQTENLGCDIYLIRLEHTVNKVNGLSIHFGEPKPEHTICGKCQHCHKNYREAPRGCDDEEYYTCDLRKDNCNCVDYYDYCSDGVENEQIAFAILAERGKSDEKQRYY